MPNMYRCPLLALALSLLLTGALARPALEEGQARFAPATWLVGKGSSCYDAVGKGPDRLAVDDGLAFPIASSRDATLLYINAGQGSTGTTALFRTACMYGIASIHWDMSCHVTQEAFNKHVEVIRALGCIQAGACRGVVAGCTLAALRRHTVDLLRAVITSGVQFLSDHPYASLVPEVLAMAPATRVLQSLRSGDEWAASRLRWHPTFRLCSEDKSGPRGPLDLFHCGDDNKGCLGISLATSGVKTVNPEQLSAALVQANQHTRRVAPPSQLREICPTDPNGIRGWEDDLRALGHARLDGSQAFLADELLWGDWERASKGAGNVKRGGTEEGEGGGSSGRKGREGGGGAGAGRKGTGRRRGGGGGGDGGGSSGAGTAPPKLKAAKIRRFPTPVPLVPMANGCGSHECMRRRVERLGGSYDVETLGGHSGAGRARHK